MRDLVPVSTRLADASPNLTQVGLRLNHYFNLAGYNPAGREGPEKASRQEGYLFYLAWASHVGIQVFSSADAHGFLRPITAAAPCATIVQILQSDPQLEFLNGLTPLLTDTNACGGQGGGSSLIPDVPALPGVPGLPGLPVSTAKAKAKAKG